MASIGDVTYFLPRCSLLDGRPAHSRLGRSHQALRVARSPAGPLSMSITLTSAELASLAQAVELLASPLNHAHVDDWRAAVNRHLRALLVADSAGFLLPVADGPALFSEEHDPVALASYPDYPPPPLIDGTPLWEAVVRAGVMSVPEQYGANYDRYLNSAYHQEYAGANGAHDTLGVAVSLGGTDARGIACMHFWHARSDGRVFGEREKAIMRLLFPAFRAGVDTFVRWGHHRADLVHALDALDQAVLIADHAGRELHRTPTLGRLLAEDCDHERITGEMLDVASVLRAAVVDRAMHVLPAPVVRRVGTGEGEYVIRGSLYGALPTGGAPLVLVALERLTPRMRGAAELRERYGLTGAELRVAALLARGLPNAEVAEALIISPHTARRHTEKVMQKLGVRSRAEVAGRVMR